MEDVEVHSDRKRLRIRGLGGLAFAVALAAAWWFLFLPDDQLDGEGLLGLYLTPFVVGFLVLAGGITLYAGLGERPRFVIRSDHLDLIDYGGPLPFSAITRIELKPVGESGQVLAIETNDEAERLSRSGRGARFVAWSNRLLRTPSFSFGTSTLHPPIDVIAWHLRERGVEIEGASPRAPGRFGG